MFSVADVTGGRLPSVPVNREPVNVTVSLLGMNPFSSKTSRGFRLGTCAGTPGKCAAGPSNPSG